MNIQPFASIESAWRDGPVRRHGSPQVTAVGEDTPSWNPPRERSAAYWWPADAFPMFDTARYAIVCELGSGGMSRVYLARDRVLDQNVALKFLRQEFENDPAMLQRFRRELSHARMLHHPNICPVYDLIQQKGGCCIVMKYVEGETLRRKLRGCGVLPLAEVVDIGSQISRGLAAAHRVLVHGDLKPGNIMIDRRDTIFLVDFGLAHTLADLRPGFGDRTSGTPGYMAPEQIEGREGDRGSDLYSLGVILYEMATGRKPFMSDSPAELLFLHLAGNPPRPMALRLDLPRRLEDLILSLMAKRKEDRPPTADVVLDLLAR